MIANANMFLEQAYKLLNREYFDGSLPDAAITIQSSPKSFGYITVKRLWKDGEESFHEINISAEHLNRPPENVLATLVHEMVHLYCLEHDIPETSKNGYYHNKRFKIEAEKRGLQIGYKKYIGYSVTEPSESLIALLRENDLLKSISHYRMMEGYEQPKAGGEDNDNTVPVGVRAGKKKTSTRKYVCSSCGISVRATKNVNIGCLDCRVVMIKKT